MVQTIAQFARFLFSYANNMACMYILFIRGLLQITRIAIMLYNNRGAFARDFSSEFTFFGFSTAIGTFGETEILQVI